MPAACIRRSARATVSGRTWASLSGSLGRPARSSAYRTGMGNVDGPAGAQRRRAGGEGDQPRVPAGLAVEQREVLLLRVLARPRELVDLADVRRQVGGEPVVLGRERA